MSLRVTPFIVIARSEATKQSHFVIASVSEAISLINSMAKQYYIYIATNKGNTVLYTGVTNNLVKRIYEHKSKLIDGFTKRYNINKLVYYEIFDKVENAILREKQIKAGPRKQKIALINNMDPDWKDLYNNLLL